MPLTAPITIFSVSEGGNVLAGGDEVLGIVDDIEGIGIFEVFDMVDVGIWGEYGGYGSEHPGHPVSLQQALGLPVIPQQPNTQGDNASATLPLPVQFHKVSEPQSLPKNRIIIK